MITQLQTGLLYEPAGVRRCHLHPVLQVYAGLNIVSMSCPTEDIDGLQPKVVV